MTNTFDTAIIGAGPAGSATARRLAESGRRVALIDKATFPRDKFCGDGLTTLALRELDELGFDPGGVASWTPVDGATLRTPSGRRVEVPLPSTGGLFAAVARRIDLDTELVRFARAGGAELLAGSAVTDIIDGPALATVELADGTSIRARHLVAADGMWSPTRKLLGVDPPKYRGEWHAFRQYFENVGAQAANELWVFFEPDLLPGYLWSFPVGGGRANVGFGILRGSMPTQRMKHLWPELLTRPHIRSVLGTNARPEAPHRAWPIPARIDQATLAVGRTLFVGDAASACDVLTGEGIGQAFVTARHAADAISGHGADVVATAEAYASGVRRELVADHRMAAALSKLLTNPRIAEASLRAVGASSWTRRNFGRWMFEDYPRALLATPRRWQRGALSAPGAYRSGELVSS